MPDLQTPTRHDNQPAKVAAFQVRGRFLTALTIRIDIDRADASFYAQLDEQLRTSPQLFSAAPVVLDFINVPEFDVNNSIRDLVVNLRRRELRVFGVQNLVNSAAADLQTLGLIALAPGRDAPLPRVAGPERSADATRPAETAPPPLVENKIVRSTIRSGQMVVAEHGDLTIIGSVASGAELVAAGNIHVYGPLRGRAMAGCHGNENAHIFCQSLAAELVAIAGVYQTSETLEGAALQRCTHIYLENEKLRMEVIA